MIELLIGKSNEKSMQEFCLKNVIFMMRNYSKNTIWEKINSLIDPEVPNENLIDFLVNLLNHDSASEK